MKTTMTLITMALAAMTATATEPAHSATSPLRELMSEAKAFEMQAREASQMLKNKKYDVAALQQALEKKGETLAKLQALAASYEASAGNLTPAQQKDWETVKTKIKLLEIFHSTKNDLVAKDPNKNRGLLRAHAQGLALRAEALQKTLQRMNP